MLRVGVSGLTGMIGKNLIVEHSSNPELQRSRTLIAFTRKDSNASYLDSHGIEYRRVDYGAPQSFSGKLEDLDAFLHLAGLTKALTPAEYFRVNVQATAGLLEALSRYGKKVRHLVFASSTAASGPADSADSPKVEDEPCRPVSHYGKSKLEAEALVRSCSLDWTVFRLPMVFGRYDYDMLYMFRMAKGGVIALFAGLHDPYSYMSARDAGRLMLGAVHDRRLYRDTFHCCYDAPLTGEEFFGMVRKQLGLPAGYRYLRLPRWVAHPASAVLDLRQRLSGKASIANPDKLKELAALYWLFSNRKLKSTLGIDVFENEGAVAETVQWYRDQALL
jgi:nucleoside-diphosphate-sugar epimerase